MNFKFVFLFSLSAQFFLTPVSAQEVTSPYSFFPTGSYFEPILMDPTACQTTIGLNKIWNSDSGSDGVYIPANLGFQQSIIRYEKHKNSGFEFGFEAAAFTQFTIKKVRENTYLGEMENVDYKFSFLINYKYQALAFRLRAFHTSSHLSDDYILRNSITESNPGTLNYEQMDLTASYHFQQTRIYGGFGMVITPESVRERFSTQAGFLFRESKILKNILKLMFGADIKIFQQNNFTPNIRTGIGFEIGNINRTHLGFLFEYYNGHLPYSVLEYKKVNWLGIHLFLM